MRGSSPCHSHAFAPLPPFFCSFDMKSIAYKTQVIFFWLLVLVMTFVVYTAKQKLLGRPIPEIPSSIYDFTIEAGSESDEQLPNIRSGLTIESAF